MKTHQVLGDLPQQPTYTSTNHNQRNNTTNKNQTHKIVPTAHVTDLFTLTRHIDHRKRPPQGTLTICVSKNVQFTTACTQTVEKK